MGIDFDALVLGPNQAIFGSPALFEPVVSQPGTSAFEVRGIFALRGQDIVGTDGEILRADVYTFGVRASEFEILPQRGDLVSGIENVSFRRFLADRVFLIDDTGDDGQGGQSWILKEQRDEDDEP